MQGCVCAEACRTQLAIFTTFHNQISLIKSLDRIGWQFILHSRLSVYQQTGNMAPWHLPVSASHLATRSPKPRKPPVTKARSYLRWSYWVLHLSYIDFSFSLALPIFPHLKMCFKNRSKFWSHHPLWGTSQSSPRLQETARSAVVEWRHLTHGRHQRLIQVDFFLFSIDAVMPQWKSMKIWWKAKTLCSLRSVHFLDETTFQNGRKMSKDVERSELFASPWVVRINSPGAAGNLGGVYPATRIYPDLSGTCVASCGFRILLHHVTQMNSTMF